MIKKKDRKFIKVNGKEYAISVHRYLKSAMCMAIAINDVHDGKPVENECVITEYLGNDIGNDSFMQPCAAYVNTNLLDYSEELKAVFNEMLKEGVCEEYKRFGEPVMAESGFAVYPLYKFNMIKLPKYDPDGYQRYIDDYCAELDAMA